MISLEKAALRRALLAKREGLPHREAKSREIRRQVLELPQFHRAKALLLYLSMGSEVDTWGIFEQALAAGKEVFAPRCLDKQGHMAFHRVDSREDLVAGAFGLLEPDPARCPLPVLCAWCRDWPSMRRASGWAMEKDIMTAF